MRQETGLGFMALHILLVSRRTFFESLICHAQFEVQPGYQRRDVGLRNLKSKAQPSGLSAEELWPLLLRSDLSVGGSRLKKSRSFLFSTLRYLLHA